MIINYKLRYAAVDDKKAVCELVYAAIGEMARDFTQGANNKEIMSRLEELFLAKNTRFSKECVVVLEIDGEITAAGCAYSGAELSKLTLNGIVVLENKGIVFANKDNLLEAYEANPDEYYIDNIAVFGKFQGNGLASVLIKYFEDEGLSLGFKKISLLAEEHNLNAKIIYEKKGYIFDKMFNVLNHNYFHMVKYVA